MIWCFLKTSFSFARQFADPASLVHLFDSPEHRGTRQDGIGNAHRPEGEALLYQCAGSPGKQYTARHGIQLPALSWVSHCVFNWVQDLETELHNGGIDEPRFFHERISLCEMMLDRFSDGKLSIDNFKAALAESHFDPAKPQSKVPAYRSPLRRIFTSTVQYFLLSESTSLHIMQLGCAALR